MGFNKNKFDVYISRFFVKTGIILSAMAIAIFFLGIVKVMVFTSTYQAAIQSDGSGSQGEIEDETEEDGQVSLTLVSISKNGITNSASSFFSENSLIVTDGSQSPPDFPPEITFLLHS